MKRFIFKYHWAIGLFIVVLGMLISARVDNWKVFAGSISASLSLIYFAQKQQLEELHLFKTLFSEFNNRYDGMNECLNPLLSGCLI